MMTYFKSISFVGIGLVGLSLVACSKDTARESQPPEPPRNVVLIILDTCRFDKLGCYGNQLGLTPRIDEFARRSVRFERAYGHAPWTLPSCASILTSLYPPQHRAGGFLPNLRGLPDSVTTLAECFQDSGYATGAVINVDYLAEAFGMTQGFADVDFVESHTNDQSRTADLTTGAALAWLERRGDKPFFLLVHYFDPHLMYTPPPEYRRRYARERDRESSDWVFGTREQISAFRKGTVHFDNDTILRAERLYDGEVAFTDHEFGRLLDGLTRLGKTRDTVVALTADHGEEFLDHGGFEHGHTLYEELVRVPLIIRVGETGTGRIVPSVVGHVDLAPTLCELVGVTGATEFAGKNMVNLINGEVEADHPIYLEGNFWGQPLRGLVSGGYKLIQHAERGAELYNLTTDALERSNLRGFELPRLRTMTTDLEAMSADMMSRKAGEDLPVELSPEQRRRLEALGYTEREEP